MSNKVEAGRRWNSWVYLGSRKSHGKTLLFHCRCDCGEKSWVCVGNLYTGASKRCRSCGSATAGATRIKNAGTSTIAGAARAAGVSPKTVYGRTALRRRRGFAKEFIYSNTRLTCRTCGEADHKTNLHEHRELLRAVRAENPGVSRQRIWQIFNVRRGLCAACPNPVSAGTGFCVEHRLVQRKRRLKKIGRRKSVFTCHGCGDKGHTTSLCAELKQEVTCAT